MFNLVAYSRHQMPHSVEHFKQWADPIEYASDPFGDVIRASDRRLKQLAADFAGGAISPEEFEEQLMAILNAMHPAAHFAGQQMSEMLPPNQALATDRGRQVAAGQVQYARGFASALAMRDPRYWDVDLEEWRSENIEARARSYMARARGTAADGWTNATPENEFMAWTLGGAEDHCPQCPALADGGPYLVNGELNFGFEVLAFKPGENMTVCMIGCKCFLTRVSDGATSPAPFDFES